MNLEQILTVNAMQKEYRNICGMKIAVEVRAGETRKGVDKQGRAWSVKMPFAYGRIQGTKGVDGESVDVILGPEKNPSKVWVVAMPKHNGNEDKVMLGFTSQKEAVRAFLRCYQHKRKFLGHVKELSVSKLKKKLVTRRGMYISAMFQSNPFTNFAYQGFDPVPPRDSTSVSEEGYKSRDAFEELEEKLRKSPDNIKFYTELTRRLGAKTIAETAVAENWPNNFDGLS